MRKKVYICAPLSEDTEADIKAAAEYAKYAISCGAAPVVPHFYAGELGISRSLSMELARSMLWFCDELWVCGDVITRSMRENIQFCKMMNIKIRYIRL